MNSNLKRKVSDDNDNDDRLHLSSSKKFKSTSKNYDPFDNDEGCFGSKIFTRPSEKNESSLYNNDNKKQTSSLSNDFIGPVIPVNYIKKDQLEDGDRRVTKNFGYSEIARNNERKNSRPDGKDCGNENVEEDDDLYGPRPPPRNSGGEKYSDGETAVEDVINEIEKRSMLMKKKLLGLEQPEASSKSTKREEWMTQLPSQFTKSFGVTARKFSTSLNHGVSEEDRSGWTDTPEDRERKMKSRATSGNHRNDDGDNLDEPSPKDLMLIRRNEQYRKFIEKHNEVTRRNKSLLEMHEEKRRKGKKKRRSPSSSSSSSSSSEEEKRKKHKKKHKKDKKSSGDAKKEKNPKVKNSKSSSSPQKEKATRRPFDRDVDLQVSRMTLTEKRSFIDKARVLNSKFGHGKSQFL
ncbi:hypothetical protein HELRODRAFT_192908 [Helobdella robusta]|uniref:DUF3752 domain-containing protein n=1 Tax=Helobdella robusta TaxID=6412 RepID=T1FUF0_HELRO|nr:hypothetical protein HELRODRAFT_192908 [Helobdella robusta]ESN98408.1 hypothetical protein HELRODRAFT_192908 [Helobdella robusta]